MKIKSIYKILIFSIVLLISLSAVAAEESMDNTTSNDDVLTSDSHDDVLTLNSNDDILTSSEKTWYVGKNTTVGGSGTQEDPFNNIELALNHSSSNDTIYINPGVYDGPHNTNLKIDIDNLTIKAKPNSVLLNANINNTRVFEVTGNDVSISGLNFSNVYMEYGGVIKWDGNGGSLTDSTIKNSKSRVGSIRWEGNNAIINNITILNSTSENGILVISGTSSNITNSTIRDTKGYYGAVMFGGKFNIIDNCTFINNTAWMNGGGVYDWGANNTVSNSLFIANNGTRGGAILTYENQPNRMNIINNTFINNIGGQAGAIVVRRAGANIDNCTFINNSAGSAGAVLILSEANITNSIFENNSASTVGGAVYITGDGSTIDNSIFINNTANNDGGAIYWSGENGTVTNTIFINNTVNNGTGEAIGYINNVTLNNVTLVNNNIEQVIVNESTPTFEYVFKLTEGYSNVKLTDNYTAFCTEKTKWSSSPRTPLIPHNDLSILKNHITGESVAEYLKILIYKYLKDPDRIRNLQQKIWIFTDDNYIDSTDSIIKEVISDYNSGFRIPNQGFSEIINDTTVLRIDFKSYNITKQIQNMIGFKSSIENITYNMSVVKNTLTPAVILGNQTTFEIKVTNTGSYYLTNVSVIEDGYDGLIYNSFSDPSGKWIFSRNSDGKPMWTYNGTLYVGISYSFNVTFNTTKTGNFTNFVVVTSNETDNKTTNNTTKVYKPDMTVEKLSLNRTVYVGNQTVFTIVVRNTGDCDLGDVFVVEKAPEGLVYNSFKGTDWSYNNGKFTYGKVLKVNES
ncbi:right-handed parallel beta-helix repeat-containing protein, partial [Methanobrevibacter sp. A27]